jgi:NADH-quinone oxidoreductase subunit G
MSLEMNVASIYVENEVREANPKQNLLHVCLSLGYDLPYFCWHPALGSVGACRQCAVKQFKDEHDTTGRIVMACMTPAADGTRISIKDPEAAQFRAAVIEGLMLHHPHDCPVCDEGGECHLQDMTVMTGHRKRTYSFGKRTFRNQYLGPFINHEMNRCIQCQRCVRFYRDYAGGHDLNAFRLRDTVFFGRHEDGVLENEFSGNLIEVCPTGVFTDATLKRHYTRKWDLQMAPSICVHCGVGCNISTGERYGTLRRVENRYNGHVNGYFLCDRGRFGYEFVNSEKRLRQPIVDGKPATKAEALGRVVALLSSGRVAGIGSPRASLEANFVLRSLVGADKFSAGFSPDEARLTATALGLLRSGPVRAPSLEDVERSDAVLILGEDITNTAPILALRVRQSVREAPMKIADKLRIPRWLDHAVREAVQEEKGPLFIAAPFATRLDDLAARTLQAAPDDIARLGFAVAHAVDSEAPMVAGLPEQILSLAETIAAALVRAERPLIISGPGCRNQAVLEAAAQVAWALSNKQRPASLSFALSESNSFGAALMDGRPLATIFEAAREHSIDTVIVLENDLFRRDLPRAVEEFFGAVPHVIVLDSLENPTVERAEIILPAAAFAESEGTLVNLEGRAQRFFKTFVPAATIQESWRWLRDAAVAAGQTACAAWLSLDDVIAAMGEQVPALAQIAAAAPSHLGAGKIAREPLRYSGRTAMLANISVHEPKPPEDVDSPLAFSMESGPQPPPPPLIPFFWSPGWNSIQAANKYQSEIGGQLRGGDPGVRLLEPGTAQLWPYFSSIPAAFRADAAAFQLVPCFHLFGSEELSRCSPGIAELSPPAYLALNPTDAALLGVHEGEEIKVSIDEWSVSLPLKFRADLARGLAAVPAGIMPAAGLVHRLTAAPGVKIATTSAAISTRGAA